MEKEETNNNKGENEKEEINKKEIVKKEGDTHSYKGWMNSDSFLKRALGVYFYSLVGYFLLIVPIILILALVLALLGQL